MSIFDLLLIVLFLASIAVFSIAMFLFIRGQRKRSIAILRGLAITAAIYFGIVIAVSLILPPRVLNVGQPLCFDDWCITVEGVERTDSKATVSHVVRLQFSNRARRATQRETNLVVYLRDNMGNRHDPVAAVANSPTIPTYVALAPTQSVTTTRVFNLPDTAVASGVVIAHEGGFPIHWFIIGEGPFRKETMVRLDSIKQR